MTILRGPHTGEAGASLPTPNTRLTRRLSFHAELVRVISETGLTQRVCFDALNAEFPTFKDYKAYRCFKYDNSDKLRQPDAISKEIDGIFGKLETIERGQPALKESELSHADRIERDRLIDEIEPHILSNPQFRRKLLHEYLRLTGK